MLWKRKKLYEMTVPELLKKRRGEQIWGLFFLAFACLFLLAGVWSYSHTGLIGPLVFCCAVSLLDFIAAAIQVFIIQMINLYVYLKEHEK